MGRYIQNYLHIKPTSDCPCPTHKNLPTTKSIVTNFKRHQICLIHDYEWSFSGFMWHMPFMPSSYASFTWYGSSLYLQDVKKFFAFVFVLGGHRCYVILDPQDNFFSSLKCFNTWNSQAAKALTCWVTKWKRMLLSTFYYTVLDCK